MTTYAAHVYQRIAQIATGVAMAVRRATISKATGRQPKPTTTHRVVTSNGLALLDHPYPRTNAQSKIRRDLTMRVIPTFCFMGLVATSALATPRAAASTVPWPVSTQSAQTLEHAFPPPDGFQRNAAHAESFAAWLRALPMKAAETPVLLHTGFAKPRQDIHARIIDIDTGPRDLQQCADAVMRLRAEWLFALGRTDDIQFNFTSGKPVPFARYAKGERPDAEAKHWRAKAPPDRSYRAFRRYMDLIYAYAGTASLEKELSSVPVADVQAGDVFIKGGFPGHAMLVADVVQNAATRETRFLLIQSYMPAQDMHVVINPAAVDQSAWYALPTNDLVTPEWRFADGSLKRWRNERPSRTTAPQRTPRG